LDDRTRRVIGLENVGGQYLPSTEGVFRMVDQNGIGLFMLASECSRIALTLQPEMRDQRIREKLDGRFQSKEGPGGPKTAKRYV
jgi:hypothetical protein